MADDASTKDALVHTSAVYLYLYDAKQGQYAQQTDSVVGCALLASSGGESFKLLFYNSQNKQPIVTTPLTSTMRFTPQQNNYINFYDKAQQNYSMRFKDAASSTAFLQAVVLAKAQAFVQDPTNYRDTSRAFITLYDDLETKKETSSGGVAAGDVVGLAWTTWQGSLSTNGSFFTQNPSDITQKTPTERLAKDGDLKRIVLGDANGDTLSRALSEALVGMNKHGRRTVAVVYPLSQQWFIGDIELVKVKKDKSRSQSTKQQDEAAPTPVAAVAAAADQDDEGTGSNSSHDDLVHRMAALSRAGSKSSGLIANMNARASLTSPESRQSSASSDERRRTSFTALQSTMEDAITHPGMVPVPLPGFVTTPSASRRSSKQSTTNTPEPPFMPPAMQQPPESFAALVIAAPYDSQEPPLAVPRSSPLESTAFASPEMENLMKEQSELADLRRKLEESKRRLEQQHNEPSHSPSSAYSTALTVTPPPFTTPPPTTNSILNGFTPWQPSPAPISSTPSSFSQSYSSAFSSSLPSGLPSFTSSLVPSTLPSPSLPGSINQYGSRSTNGTVAASPELENNIMRLQRSSSSIESTLHDLQSKMDRLLNMQNSSKASKYSVSSPAGGYFSSSIGAGSTSSGTSSSATLLKNLEKALAQRDQLQDMNARLQDAKDQMESTIEDLQNQHESLQLENRNLFEKSQSGNHMQQEKFRMEVRSVQQQLSQTQEQMLAYQEENFRLRQELAAKDEQVTKEKAQVQEDARKQLEHLQRQLQLQVHEESKEALSRLQADKLRGEKQLSEVTAQKTQVEMERDALANQVRVLQGQQSQWGDEKARLQAQQDTNAKELVAQLQQAGSELVSVKQQLEKYRTENRQLADVVASKEQQMMELQDAKTKQEYAALSELLKEFMNDIYFHFQDAFEEDAEFTGKEIVMAIRKILKQNTMEILSKLEEFWQQQHQDETA